MSERSYHAARTVPFLAVTILLLAIVLPWSVSTAGAQGMAMNADLRVVGGLEVHPPLPDEGEDVQIGVLVQNGGASDLRDVPIYFYEDGVWFDKEVVDIKAGDTVYVQTYWTAVYGDTYISVSVDPGGNLNENRENEDAGTWMTVRRVPLE